MHKGIFREYDVRGVFGRDFDLGDVERIGQGLGTRVRRNGGRSAAVGRDCRLSSPDIREALIQGILKTGVHVIDLGICPTPLVYFSLRTLDVQGGVIVTASHNPPEYNGFKVCLGHDTIFGDDIQAFRELIERGDFEDGSGTITFHDIISDYSEYIINNINLKRGIRLAVDAGNGTGGVVAGPLLERLGCRVEPLYFEMDGRFPNHIADPTVPENMEDLSRLVLEKGLELGIGLDGDADRIGVVDENGRLIFGDMLTLILARELLLERPGATIVADVKSSQLLYDDIQARGGRALMWKTGHSLIKNKLKTEQADLAGEMSGHIFFAHRYFGFDDGIYTACRLLEIVSSKKEPISRYLSDLPKTFHTPEIRVACPEEHKFELVKMVRDRLASEHNVIAMDGVRVVFDDGWGLLRASNTGPVLVLRFEALSEARLREIRSLVEGTLEAMKRGL
jgi:phosphomannomutase / phosphoglucomutase